MIAFGNMSFQIAEWQVKVTMFAKNYVGTTRYNPGKPLDTIKHPKLTIYSAGPVLYI